MGPVRDSLGAIIFELVMMGVCEMWLGDALWNDERKLVDGNILERFKIVIWTTHSPNNGILPRQHNLYERDVQSLSFLQQRYEWIMVYTHLKGIVIWWKINLGPFTVKWGMKEIQCIFILKTRFRCCGIEQWLNFSPWTVCPAITAWNYEVLHLAASIANAEKECVEVWIKALTLGYSVHSFEYGWDN